MMAMRRFQVRVEYFYGFVHFDTTVAVEGGGPKEAELNGIALALAQVPAGYTGLPRHVRVISIRETLLS